MAKPLLAPKELEPNVSPAARIVMAELIMGWAMFEASLSHFLLLAFGIALDEGSILIGNMDTRTKLDRLQTLYKHHGMKSAATNIRNLIAVHKHFVDVRNVVAHHVCMGHYVADPDMLMFSAGRVSPGHKGMIRGVSYSVHQMSAATDFAYITGEMLSRATNWRKMRRSKLPVEPPSFPLRRHPSPQKHEKGKRGKPPQGRSR